MVQMQKEIEMKCIKKLTTNSAWENFGYDDKQSSQPKLKTMYLTNMKTAAQEAYKRDISKEIKGVVR